MRLTALTLPPTRESGFAQLAFTTPRSKNRLIIDKSVLEKLKDLTGFTFTTTGSNGHISAGNGLFIFNPSANTKTISRIAKNTEKNDFPANTKFIVFGTSNDNENFGSMIVAERGEGDNFTIVNTLSEVGEMINPDLLIVLNVLGEDDINASKTTPTPPANTGIGTTTDHLALRKSISTLASSSTGSEPTTKFLTNDENSIKVRALEIIIHALEVGYINISDLDSVAKGVQYMTIDEVLKIPLTNEPIRDHILRYACNDINKENEAYFFLGQNRNFVTEYNYGYLIEQAKIHPDHTISQGIGLNETLRVVLKKEESKELQEWAFSKKTKFGKALIQLFSSPLPKPTTKPTIPALPITRSADRSPVKPSSTSTPPERITTGSTTHKPTNPPSTNHSTAMPHKGRVHLLERSSDSLELAPADSPKQPEQAKSPHKGRPSLFEKCTGENLLIHTFSYPSDLYQSISLAMDEKNKNNEKMVFFGQRKDVITSRSLEARLDWARQNSNHCFSQGIGLNENLADNKVTSKKYRIALNKWASEDENKETKFAKSLKILFEKYPDSIKSEETNPIKSEKTVVDDKETDSTHKIFERFTDEEVLSKEMAHGTKQYYLQRAFYPENSNNEKLIFFGQRKDVLPSPNAATRYYRWTKENPNHCFSEGLGLNENIFDDGIVKPEKREDLYKWANEENNKETKLGKSLISLFTKHAYSPKPAPKAIPTNLPTTNHEAIPTTNKSVLNIKQWREVSMNPLNFNFPSPEIIPSFIKEMQSPNHSDNELALRAGMIKSILNEGNAGEVVEWILNNPEHKFAKGLLRNDTLCELHLDMEQAEKLLQMIEPNI